MIWKQTAFDVSLQEKISNDHKIQDNIHNGNTIVKGRGKVLVKQEEIKRKQDEIRKERDMKDKLELQSQNSAKNTEFYD